MLLHCNTKDKASARSFFQSCQSRNQVSSEQRKSLHVRHSKLCTNQFLMLCVSISQAASAGHDLYRGALNIKQFFFFHYLLRASLHGVPHKPVGVRDAKKPKNGDLQGGQVDGQASEGVVERD